MKKQYKKPSMSIDIFEANEYIATCYKVNCCAPRGDLWLETNNQDGLQTSGWNRDTHITKWGSYFYPCGEFHKAELKDGPSKNGYVVTESNTVVDAFIWDNRHATTLNPENWYTNSNAS